MSKITTNMNIFKGCVSNQKNGQLIQVQAFLDKKIIKGLRCELLYTELLDHACPRQAVCAVGSGQWL